MSMAANWKKTCYNVVHKLHAQGNNPAYSRTLTVGYVGASLLFAGVCYKAFRVDRT